MASKRKGLREPTYRIVSIDDIDDSRCVARRAPYGLSKHQTRRARGGIEQSVQLFGQLGAGLLAPEKVRGKWVLLDGLRTLAGLKAAGVSTMLVEIADADPAVQQLQIVTRHNVMPHLNSARVRLLAQWRKAYLALHPDATKHGGDRSRQGRTDAQLGFTEMAALEWRKSRSTINRWLQLEDASDEVLRDFDAGNLTLTESVSLAGKPDKNRTDLLKAKQAPKASAALAEIGAADLADMSNHERFWANLEAAPEQLRQHYPQISDDIVARLKAWLDEIRKYVDRRTNDKTSERAA